jgi:hypothetical protein
MKDPYAHLTARQAAVRRYFTPTPTFPRVVVSSLVTVLGLLLLLSGVASAFYAIVGIVVTFLGARKCVPRIYRYLQDKKFAEPKPSDAQMDLWLAEAFDPARSEGFRRLDIVRDQLINPEAPPLLVIGFPQNGVSYRLARGLDGLVRCDKYDILVVYLTNWHLCTYQCMLDMETGAFISDETHEFHYRDVLSVATSSDRLVIPLPVDHSKPSSPALEGGTNTGQADEKLALESTTSMMFRLRVASDEIKVLVRLFDYATKDEDKDLDFALKQIRGRLRDYTRLHDEKGAGAFDDLHQARQRAERPWPGDSQGWPGAAR